jgi:hypothetical protein
LEKTPQNEAREEKIKHTSVEHVVAVKCALVHWFAVPEVSKAQTRATELIQSEPDSSVSAGMATLLHHSSMFQSRAQAPSAPKAKAISAAPNPNENFVQRLYRVYWSDPNQRAKLLTRAQNLGFFVGGVVAIKYYGQEFPFTAASTAAASESR